MRGDETRQAADGTLVSREAGSPGSCAPEPAASPARETVSRRAFLGTAAAGAVALPTIVSARALGLERAAAASERVTLGVIGIGNRCKYVLGSMLGLPDGFEIWGAQVGTFPVVMAALLSFAVFMVFAGGMLAAGDGVGEGEGVALVLAPLHGSFLAR